MNRLFKKAMDPVSSETHFVGAIASFIGMLIMILLGFKNNVSFTVMLGAIIFCVSAICLYSASAIYHFFYGNEKVKLILRKLDHSMIYVLIVGTYTPIVLICMEAPHSYYFLTVLWSIALLGIIVKILWLNAPRVITTGIYLLLGWSLVFDFQAFSNIPSNSLILIAAGGIAYSTGAFIYIFKKPNFTKDFGFHEFFHLFVMAGSLFHYFAILLFLV